MNIWNTLSEPFFILAPMEAVTDAVFRKVIHEAAPADLYMTEFTNATSFVNPKGEHSTRSRLHVDKNEGPVIAQIWGKNPEEFAQMSQALGKRGVFTGIDINFGCPDKSIVKQGACSALIGNQDIVQGLIAAAKEGGLPVSVKTRLGQKEVITEEWFSFLLEQNVAAITVHGRTAKEMSKVPAHWDEIAKVVKLRDKIAPQTKIVGNGDVRDRSHGLELIAQTGVDGIMIGRGIFHNPFAFEKTPRQHTSAEHITLLKRHLALYGNSEYPGSFAALKKFFKVYIHDFPGASDIRARLMESKSLEEVDKILVEIK